MNSICFVVTKMNNESFFRELAKFLLNYSEPLIITIWGKQSKAIHYELLRYMIKRRGLRSRIAREYNYVLLKTDADNFFSICEKINLRTMAWGICINENAIVLAKSSEEVDIFINELIPFNEMVVFLNKATAAGIIGGYNTARDS